MIPLCITAIQTEPKVLLYSRTYEFCLYRQSLTGGLQEFVYIKREREGDSATPVRF